MVIQMFQRAFRLFTISYRSSQSHLFRSLKPLSEKHSRTRLKETSPATGSTRISPLEDTEDRNELKRDLPISIPDFGFDGEKASRFLLRFA